MSEESPAASRIAVVPLEPAHWEAVVRIYSEGIATRNATFETEAPTWEAWDRGHLSDPRLVALDGDEVVGWTALSPVSDRCVYGGVVEESVYVAEAARGNGIGTLLLEELIRRTDAAGIWTIQTGIFPENEVSIRLHERVGFRVLGVREKLGKLDGTWRDVAFLERRSPTVL